jgi:hypothetical protein
MIATAEMFTASTRTAGFVLGHARGVLLARQVVTPAELVERVNRQLAAREDCEGLEVEAGDLGPRLPDADGCNWRPGALRLRVAHGPSTRALAGMRQVVEWARLTFELADPED